MPYRLVLAPALMLAVAVTPALAEPVDTRTARDLLYRDDRAEVTTFSTEGLSDQDVAVLSQVAQTQKYYAAVAYAPDEGILSEPTVMSANYHSVDAARAAALAGCNERRNGGATCEIALEVRPQGWEPRALQLSADATTAFNDEYRRAGGTRAFAISASTGLWGIGRGDHAQEDALAACQGDAEVSDCAIVIAD